MEMKLLVRIDFLKHFREEDSSQCALLIDNLKPEKKLLGIAVGKD